jgi:hypothetical protein
MNIIGCDLHTRYQVVAWMEEESGEIRTRRLEQERGEARAFYAAWPQGAVVGVEATFPALWFERLLGECGHELWVGDAAKIRASETRKQKYDGRDAEHILDLLLANRFPRIWTPCGEDRDLRQLLVHRMKLVRTRTAVKNQLHYLAISQGVCRKHKLWTEKGRAELEGVALLPWASRRRKELLEMLDQLDAAIEPLDRAVEQAARARAEAERLMTHPGCRSRGEPGHGADAGAGGAVSGQPQAGQLPGAESARELLGRPPAVGRDLQARQLDAALAAGGGGADGGATGSGVAPCLSTAEVSPGERGSESGHRPPPGGSSVLDAARADGLRAAGSHVRQPE